MLTEQGQSLKNVSEIDRRRAAPGSAVDMGIGQTAIRRKLT